MATAAFKSSSRRGINTLSNSITKTTSSDIESKQNSSKKTFLRRSRSVSSLSRTELDISSLTASDFPIKRDNPLFQTSNSTPDGQIHSTNSKKLDGVELRSTNSKAASSEHTRRGRSVSRNADVGRNVSGIGRSFSRTADTGRRYRSVSRCPSSREHYANSESTTEREDEVSTSSFPEAEEKTIKAVSEQMKSLQGYNLEGDASASGIYETVVIEVRRAISEIQSELENAMKRSKTAASISETITDIPPDLVNPGAVELVMDIRGEYAKKLEQSQERAKKLRADLAVEEHRSLELNRILKEVLPAPKASDVQKPRTGRKSSFERRKMSKRLTEEAMAYFDECVSLSTFDGSDFSSQEDPPLKAVGIASHAGNYASLLHASSNFSGNYVSHGCCDNKQEDRFTCSGDVTELTAGSSSKEGLKDKFWSRKFSFGSRPCETLDLQQDIMNYVKKYEGIDTVSNDPRAVSSKCHDMVDYNLDASSEGLVFDRILLKSRLESGSMLLCHRGTTISSSTSAFII